MATESKTLNPVSSFLIRSVIVNFEVFEKNSNTCKYISWTHIDAVFGLVRPFKDLGVGIVIDFAYAAVFPVVIDFKSPTFLNFLEMKTRYSLFDIEHVMMAWVTTVSEVFPLFSTSTRRSSNYSL